MVNAGLDLVFVDLGVGEVQRTGLTRRTHDEELEIQQRTGAVHRWVHPEQGDQQGPVDVVGRDREGKVLITGRITDRSLQNSRKLKHQGIELYNQVDRDSVRRCDNDGYQNRIARASRGIVRHAEHRASRTVVDHAVAVVVHAVAQFERPGEDVRIGVVAITGATVEPIPVVVRAA